MLQPKSVQQDFSLVIRTDFSDEISWKQICSMIQKSQTPEDFRALVECVSDKKYSGIKAGDIRSILPAESRREFVFLVDSVTISQDNHALLVVDTTESVRTFRVIPSEVWSVENNLRLGNMDFSDFLDAVNEDGEFLGF